MQDPQNISTHHRRHLFGILAGIFAAFLLTVLCYSPSLGGPFLFDDVPNLELLGDRGGLTSADKYLDFITSAQAGPLGRPVSLASFTLNGQNWPTDPRPFRITNLIIHLINGLLVFLLGRVLFSSVYKQRTADYLALLCMALWLLHPLLVSTTAYIVQRMTLLSSLFTLAGLLCYVRGRSFLPEDSRHGWTWIIAGMGACGTLALLSKETGILLPFYALVIELTVFSSFTLAQRQKTLLIAVLCLPLVVAALFIAANSDARLLGFEFREFTLQERLLTQAVVLIDYLRQIVAPQLSGLGIFHDDYPISRGMLDPVATSISLTLIAALLFFAAWSRKRWPLVSLGILWFFAGHSLEAGPLPLEIYFEHRNYLPLFGPVLAICSLLPLLNENMRRVLPLLLFLIVSMESFLAWQSAAPWGSEELLMRTTLAEHPGSLRARQYEANRHIIRGEYAEALATQRMLSTRFPEHTSTRLGMLNLSCILNTATKAQVDSTLVFLKRSDYDAQIIGFLNPIISNAAAGSCAVLGFDEVQTLFDSLLLNPTLSKNDSLRGAAHYHKGIAYRQTGELDDALEQLDLSYAAKPEIDIRMRQVVWLIGAGRLDDAEHYLALARQHDARFVFRSNLRAADLETLQQRIAEARARQD